MKNAFQKSFPIYSVFVLAMTFIMPTITTAQEELNQDSSLTVSVAALSSLEFFPLRSSPASVLSLNDSKISAEISAVITAIPVRVGDLVTRGDLLAELDCRQTRLNYDVEMARVSQLSASLELGKRELSRQQTLVAGGNIGESTFDRSQTEVLSKESQLLAQQAALDLAALNVQRCTIFAPYDGVVTQRLANEGESLQRGAPVIRLVQLDELEVMVNLALGDLESFNEAHEYFFQQNDELFPLALRALLPLVENNTRIREARFTFTNQTAIAGSSGRLVWESPLSHIPARFLQLRNSDLGVFIVENNRAKFITIEDAEEGRPVAFDMNGSTLIVTDGRFGLVDGQAINIR